MGRVGQQFIRFDAPCKRAAEQGFHDIYAGSRLMGCLLNGKDNKDNHAFYKLYNPPKSEWLMPIPLQFKPNWPDDPYGNLSAFVLDKTRWTYSPELAVAEWVPTTRPGHSGAAAHKWQSFVVPASVTSVGKSDFSDVSAAIGHDLPTGLTTVAQAYETPAGGSFAEAEYCPVLTWGAFPAPQDVFVFGFNQFVIVIRGQELFFLREKVSSSTGYDLLAQTHIGRQNSRLPSLFTNGLEVEQRGVMVLPVGINEMWLHFMGLGLDPLAVQVRDVKSTQPYAAGQDGAFLETADGATLITPPAGNIAWWMAAAPGQHLSHQVQVVGYEAAAFTYANVAPMFDLGKSYMPTQAPEFGAQVVFRGLTGDFAGSDPSAAVAVSTAGSGDKTWAHATSHQYLTVGLRDEAGNPWNSDGTHHAGYISLEFGLGNPSGSTPAYLAPQVRVVDLRFPVLLDNRAVNTVTIDDTHFTGWNCTTSLQDPLGKRINIALVDSGATLLENAGLTKRGNYRVEILEDTDGNGTPDTLRASGWMKQPGHVLHRVAPSQATLTTRRFAAHGNMARADQPFSYLPNLCDPSSHGFIEHSFAVKEVLRQAGIDVDDGAQYFTVPDPFAGTFNARLPGTWAYTPGSQDLKVDSPWGPDWGEKRAGYCGRIATTWASWSFYEDMPGAINYHPELFSSFLGLRGGYRYYVSAVLYQSEHDALAAGVSRKQKFQALAEAEVWEPVCNEIIVTGTDTQSRNVPHKREADDRALTDLTYENYTGHYITQRVTSKLCISDETMGRIARVMLELLKHRSVIWKVRVPLAAWQLQLAVPTGLGGFTLTPASVDVGRVVTLDGFGDFRVLQMTHETVSAAKNVHNTDLILQSLPKIATYGAVPGAWPGIAS